MAHRGVQSGRPAMAALAITTLVLLGGCGVAAQVTPSATTGLGAVYQLPFAPSQQTVVHATGPAQDAGPPLLEIDNAESVTGQGLSGLTTMQPGTFVLFYYKRNLSNGPLYFLPVLINHGSRPVTVTVTRKGASVGPTSVGTDMAFEYAYLKQTIRRTIVVPADGWKWLDPALTTTPTQGNSIVAAGQFLASTSGPVEVGLVAVSDPSTANPLTLPLQPAVLDEGPSALRGQGLFTHSQRTLSFQIRKLPSTFVLASDRSHPKSTLLDPYITGTDPPTGPSILATDAGNYGMLYHVHIAISGQPGQQVGIFLSGNGPMAMVGDTEQLLNGQAVMLPVNGFGTRLADAGVLLATATLNGSGQQTVRFHIFPPSGLSAIMFITVLPMSNAHIVASAATASAS